MKKKFIKSGLVTVIAGSQLFSLVPTAALAETNAEEVTVEGKQKQTPPAAIPTEKNTAEGTAQEEQKQTPPAAIPTEKNTAEGTAEEEQKQTPPAAIPTEKNTAEGAVEAEQQQTPPAAIPTEKNKNTDSTRGINWAAKGKINRYNKEPFNQNTRQGGKLDLEYAVDIQLGTQLGEYSNILIQLPETLNNIRKQVAEKGYDFRKYIKASVSYPDPVIGVSQRKKNYEWNEIDVQYGNSLLLQVPRATFLIWANFTTDITFNYGDLIRDTGITPNKGDYDGIDFAWIPEVMDWTVVGNKKVHQDVNPLIIGENPTIHAEDKSINVGDKFDPLEGVSATDAQGNPLKVVIESNTVDTNKPGSYQVKYSATDQYGNKAEKTIKVTVNAPTEKPTITAEDKSINVGDKFNPLEGVSAIGSDGKPLEVVVESNTVDTNKPGSYQVKYSATDQYGNRAEKTIKVTVNAPTEKPTITVEDKSINVGDKFDPLKGVSAIGSDGKPLKVVVESNTVDTNKPGSYQVKYSATDQYGNRAEKTIKVTVKENENYSITVNDYNIDSDSYLTGTVGKDVAKVQITVNGKVVNNIEPTADGRYRAYGRGYIASVMDVVKVISLDKNGNQKETATAKLMYNEVILTAKDYTIGTDMSVMGSIDKRATKVILYDTDENKAIRQGKINKNGTYEISADDIIISKNKNYAVVAFEGNAELKRVAVNVKEKSQEDYILTANDYTPGEQYISGEYDPQATKVVLYVDGTAVKNSALDSTNHTYKVAAKSLVTSKNQKVEVVESKGTTELKRVQVNVKEAPQEDYVLTANDYT
ncbi:DUF5011 domain-containing protein, partial [Bacillus cereus]|nr:DUF5011 domain-containing protein [Bacillus cereus]